MLTNQWMGKILERLVVLYSHAPWQVRATLFGSVVGGLGECAALRYLCPDDSLWQQAAAGLVSVINAGLPAVNIMFVNHHQPPENAWQIVAKTFEMFLLGVNLPEGLMQQAAGRAQQQRLGSRELSHVSSSGSSSMSRRRSAEGTKKGSSSSSSQKVSDDPAEVESRLQVGAGSASGWLVASDLSDSRHHYASRKSTCGSIQALLVLLGRHTTLRRCRLFTLYQPVTLSTLLTMTIGRCFTLHDWMQRLTAAK